CPRLLPSPRELAVDRELGRKPPRRLFVADVLRDLERFEVQLGCAPQLALVDEDGGEIARGAQELGSTDAACDVAARLDGAQTVRVPHRDPRNAHAIQGMRAQLVAAEVFSR